MAKIYNNRSGGKDKIVIIARRTGRNEFIKFIYKNKQKYKSKINARIFKIKLNKMKMQVKQGRIKTRKLTYKLEA